MHDINAVFNGRGEEALWLDSGRLRIVSDTDETLEVLAGTGDPDTYQLVSTVTGVSVSEISRWDVNGCEFVNAYWHWQQNLDRQQCVCVDAAVGVVISAAFQLEPASIDQ